MKKEKLYFGSILFLIVSFSFSLVPSYPVAKYEGKPVENKEKEEQKEQVEEIPVENELPTVQEPETPIEKPTIPVENQNSGNSVPSASEVINQKRKTIEQKYGVRIKYGNEIGSYYNLTKVTDLKVISQKLGLLEQVLTSYPTDFFRSFTFASGNQLSLTFLLFGKEKNQSYEGYTTVSGSQARMLVSVESKDFMKTTNHEIFHAMEYYIRQKSGNAFPAWGKYNPSDFRYGTTSKKYLYDVITNKENAYFFDSYAMKSGAEDRAMLFAELNSPGSRFMPCFTKGQPLRAKAEYLASQIEKYFSTVSSSKVENWERFKKW